MSTQLNKESLKKNPKHHKANTKQPRKCQESPQFYYRAPQLLIDQLQIQIQYNLCLTEWYSKLKFFFKKNQILKCKQAYFVYLMVLFLPKLHTHLPLGCTAEQERCLQRPTHGPARAKPLLHEELLLCLCVRPIMREKPWNTAVAT